MAVTQNTYTGNGSTVLFSFTFPYLETTDIKVSVNGTTTTAYTLANATTIQFNTAPANGAAIRIYRETDDTGVASTFFAGSAIRAQDLNSNFTQNLYVTQESNREATTAVSTANSALSNSNTAISTANSAVSTANSAVSTANSAVSTANTANTNASAAVSTANTASSNASTAVSTANAASATAASAVTTANSAVSTANGAVSTANAANSTANTALTAANSAVSTANTASTNASNAVSTANTANTNASTAVSTANTASTNASTAVSTANTANTKADQAIAAVSNSINFQLKANVAAIPATPANDTYIEVQDSTGLESFTPLAGKPAGFVGDAGLSVRLRYTTAGTTWNWLNYYANDSDARFLKKTGGTMTGKITLDGNPSANLHPATKQYVDAADATLTSAAAAAQSTANTAVSNAAAAQSTANTAVTNAAAAQSTANTAVTNAAAAQATADAALPKAGGTATGNISAPAFIPTGGTAPTNGVYLPAANSVAISTNGTGRLFVDASGRVGVGTSSPGHPLTVQAATATTSLQSTTGTNQAWHAVSNTGGNVYFGVNNSAGTFFNTAAYGGIFWHDGNYPLIFGNNNAEKMRLDTSGRLGIGTTSPGVLLDVSTGSSDIYENIRLYNRSSGNHTRWGITCNHGDNTKANVALINGVSLSDNTSNTISIGGGEAGSGLCGVSTISFKTTSTPGTASSATERARIDSSGRLLVGTSSATANGGILQLSSGITFPATQVDVADPNTLDDYEEGSCTLTIRDSGGNSATMGAGNVFQYRKIGSFVFVSGTLAWSSTSALLAGSRIQIHGLPFASNGTTHMRWVVGFGSAPPGSFLITRSEIAFGIDAGQSFIWGTKVSGNNADGGLTKADLANSGGLYGLTISYNT